MRFKLESENVEKYMPEAAVQLGGTELMSPQRDEGVVDEVKQESTDPDEEECEQSAFEVEYATIQLVLAHEHISLKQI